MTCEGAFSYLARDFGLKEAYLWPMNADQTGTPQQVRSVIDTLRENNVCAVFCESTVNTDPAEQVAREIGAAYGGVLYVDSLTLENGPVPTYLDLLRSPPKQSSKASPSEFTPRAAPNLKEPSRPYADGLTVTYRNGVTALKDTSFAIPRGTIAALVGVKGAGKSASSARPCTSVDVQTEEAITTLVSTSNLGSVPEFCNQTVLVKGSVRRRAAPLRSGRR